MLILLTPQTPVYIIVYLFIVSITVPSPYSIYAQEVDSVKISVGNESNMKAHILPLEDLEASLKKHYNTEWLAERQEYEYKVKGKVLSYIPTVGFTLGMPSVSWNTKSAYNIDNVKRMNKAKIESIDSRYKSLYNDALHQLKIMYEKYHVELSTLTIKENLLSLDAEIFQIYEEAYTKQELTPLAFLQHKKAYESKKAELLLFKKELVIKKLELYEFAKYGKEEEEL